MAGAEEGAQVTGGLGNQKTGPWDRRVVQVKAVPANFGGGAWIWGQGMVPCHH